jgi:hypothetical protein
MAAALEDARDYLGQETFNKVVKTMGIMLQQEGIRIFAKRYAFILSFAGVQGAPARAIALLTIRNHKL